MSNKYKHGGPGRGQGRKPFPVSKRKVKHTVWLSPNYSKWLKDQAEQLDVKEGFIVEQLITMIPDGSDP